MSDCCKEFCILVQNRLWILAKDGVRHVPQRRPPKTVAACKSVFPLKGPSVLQHVHCCRAVRIRWLEDSENQARTSRPYTTSFKWDVVSPPKICSLCLSLLLRRPHELQLERFQNQRFRRTQPAASTVCRTVPPVQWPAGHRNNATAARIMKIPPIEWWLLTGTALAASSLGIRGCVHTEGH